MVDDEADLEPLILQKFRHQIRAGEFEFVFARDGLEALEKIKKVPDLDIVISDINMPGMDGLTLLDQLNHVGPLLKAVVVSAYGDMHNIRTAMNRGAFDFITKPVNFDDLELTIRRTLEHLTMLRNALEARTKLIAFNQELAVTAKLQQAILPKKYIENNNVHLHASMQPATDVGGDFYDFFWLDERHLGLVMADVSGKGITAGMFMAVARTHLKAIASFCAGPVETMEKLNATLCEENDTAMFVTVFYGILDTHTGILKFANAGHCLPVILSTGKDPFFEKQIEGLGAGVLEDATYEEGEIKLGKDDTLILYTDGVTEAMNEQNEEFGNDRLLSVVKNNGTLDVQGFNKLLIEEVQLFAGTAPQSDDITVLTLKYLGD